MTEEVGRMVDENSKDDIGGVNAAKICIRRGDWDICKLQYPFQHFGVRGAQPYNDCYLVDNRANSVGLCNIMWHDAIYFVVVIMDEKAIEQQ